MSIDIINELLASFKAFNYESFTSSLKQAQMKNANGTEILKALEGAMSDLCGRYENRELSVAHLCAAGGLFRLAHEYLKSQNPVKGKAIICTMGSVHYGGKNIVKWLMAANGYEMIDIGENVSPDRVVESVAEFKPDLVCMSAALVICLPLQAQAIQMLKAHNMRDNIKVLIGGGVTSQAWADRIGADGWAKNGPEAVREADRVLRELRGGRP
jgi:5-methyltetrahydrofolate--homocysteine methyltransferase